jgi:flagellar biosynthesis/type III secretory pathway protein FliH
MISLSSIVKARQLVNLPKKDNAKHLKEVQLAIQAVQTERNQDISEWLEKKETIIKQALKKAKHIENDAELRAEAIINNAISDSREIISTAEKKGYDDGYRRGLADGALASEKAAEESLLELKQLIDCFRSEQLELKKREGKHLIDIAFELAKKNYETSCPYG